MRVSLVIACCLWLQGCYLLEQGRGQWNLRFNQVPLAQAAQTNPDPKIRQLLTEVPGILAFGQGVMLLKQTENYQGYYHTELSGITFVVTAAKPLELERKTWWFPLVGLVPYRGYFNPDDAKAMQRELELRGWEVYVFPAPAYSTLGWLKDPITTPMFREGLPGLAESLFHEMAHATLYRNGHGDFNEQLASFVGLKGVEQYLTRAGRLAELAQWQTDRRREQAKLRRVHQSALALARLFASSASPEEKTQAKAAEYAKLTQDLLHIYPGTSAKVWEFNNARLMTTLLYDELAPWPEELWLQAGGDWAKFWQGAKAKADALGPPAAAEDPAKPKLND